MSGSLLVLVWHDTHRPCMKNAFLFGSLLYFCLVFYFFGFLSCLLQNHNPQPLAESAARLMYLRVYDSRDSSRQPVPSPSLCYSLTHAHKSIVYRHRNPKPLTESVTRLMRLRVYDNRDSSHQSAPSPSLCYSLTLQFPAVRPLGLGLVYVYPCNPVCARRFRSSCLSV
jgi:hypothetical protein